MNTDKSPTTTINNLRSYNEQNVNIYSLIQEDDDLLEALIASKNATQFMNKYFDDFLAPHFVYYFDLQLEDHPSFEDVCIKLHTKGFGFDDGNDQTREFLEYCELNFEPGFADELVMLMGGEHAKQFKAFKKELFQVAKDSIDSYRAFCRKCVREARAKGL